MRAWLLVGFVVVGCSSATTTSSVAVRGDGDFGAVFCSDVRHFSLENTGTTAVTLTRVEATGATVRAAPYLDQGGPTFLVSLPPHVALAAGASLGFDVAYTPDAGSDSAQVSFVFDGARAELSLQGSNAPSTFAPPPPVDFGCVARGDVGELPTLTRPLDVPDAGTSGTHFTDGAFTIGPDGNIQFRPQEAKEYVGSVPVMQGACVAGYQRVLGTGVDQVLTWSSTTVDFGYVPPGRRLDNAVLFRNCAFNPVTFSAMGAFESTSPSTVFSVDAVGNVPAATRSDAGVLVPGDVTVRVSFAPTVLGMKVGTLRASTDLTQQSALVVPLRGVGGGPVVQVTPAVLDFGAVTGATTRQVTVKNVGTRATPADPLANLFLGTGGAEPYYTLSGCSAPVTMSAYDPQVGIEAGNQVTLSVTVSNATSCVMRVYTNDLAEPVTMVTILAQ
jgi:hypothetical protein